MATPFYDLFDDIRAGVTAAWSPAKIIYGEIPLIETTLPVVAIRLMTLQKIPGPVVKVNYRYEFHIMGRWQFPQDVDNDLATNAGYVEQEKLARANELHNALITSANFGGVGNLPRFESVEFGELESHGERAYDMTAVFVLEAISDRT